MPAKKYRDIKKEFPIDEGKLVSGWNEILKVVTDKIQSKLGKEYQKNPEKGVAMINTLGAMVGAKVTDKKQQKGKLFLKFGDEIEEGAKYTNVHNKIKKIRNLKRKESEFIANIDPAVLGQVVKALMPMFEEIQKEFELVEASSGEMIDSVFKLKGNRIAGLGIAKLLSMTDVKVLFAMQKQNPRGFKKTIEAIGKETGRMSAPTEKEVMKMFKKAGVKPIPEELDNDDKPVVKKIVTMLKKASKKHAKQAGDLEKAVSEELEENTKASLPFPRLKKSGKFSIGLAFPAPNTLYSIKFRNYSFMISPGDIKDLIKILSQRDIVTKNPKGMAKLPEEVSEGKGKNFAQQAAIAIAKKKSGKYDKDGKKINASHCSEDLDEKVKDGKVDPLSKMGKSKLTGSEIQKYYRDNPKQKAAARDKTVKKAIELALDLSGATNYAIKEIEKLKRGLSKLPAVKLALQHANESKEFTGHHVVIEQLSGANMVKLKTYGKMMAKMTKLPFDENDPEKGIDKLMGQVWKQKHVPANWERLHKMVMMLKGIGVKMPSLKGKYMGLDPVSKKAIFYKEGTNDIVDWNNDISEIKEGIEEIVEAQEMKDADVKKIAQMTDRNDHNGSLMHLAKVMGDRKSGEALKGIMQTHKALGHMPKGLIDTRMAIFDDLMKQSKKKYRNHNDIYSAL